MFLLCIAATEALSATCSLQPWLQHHLVLPAIPGNLSEFGQLTCSAAEHGRAENPRRDALSAAN